MLSKLKQFVCRHRRKIVISGLVVGGVLIATNYARRKLLEWQEREVKEFLERTRRQQLFEKNERTCNKTILSFIPTLVEKIEEIFDTKSVLDKLRSGTENKIALWEELKILSFSRLATIIYSGTLLVIMFRTQVNIIAGYLCNEMSSTNKSGYRSEENSVVSDKIQERYLCLCQYFLTNGVKDLSSLIKSKVRLVLQNESLKKQLTLPDIERYFWAIQSSISADVNNPITDLTSYLLSPHLDLEDLNKSESELMKKLVNETYDLFRTNEVKSLGASCISRGFSQVMDNISEYIIPNKNSILTPQAVSLKITEVPVPSTSNNHNTSECQTVLPLAMSPKISNGTFVSPHKLTTPMAKLIPIINGLTSMSGCEQWVQEFTNMQSLKIFGANIYESFSNPR